jgi:hypothetical protein
MTISRVFSDIPAVDDMPLAQAKEKLREIGENEVADALEQTQSSGKAEAFANLSDLFSFLKRPPPVWLPNGHTYGYLASDHTGRKDLPIKHAGDMDSDQSLKNTRLRITLNHLYVAKYPGNGMHHILLHFSARNQLPGNSEEAHFNMMFRGYDGAAVAVIGHPIFVGLNVGSEGVSFGCKTVNVQNDDDQKFLEFLDSGVFKTGLSLVSTLQPAIAPLSGMVVGITKSIAQRFKNVPVQEFDMGLDFSDDPSGARLAEGSYIAVQLPPSLQQIWDWDEWQFNRSSGQIVNKADASRLIPYNYIIFGVTRYEGP